MYDGFRKAKNKKNKFVCLNVFTNLTKTGTIIIISFLHKQKLLNYKGVQPPLVIAKLFVIDNYLKVAKNVSSSKGLISNKKRYKLGKLHY